MRSIFIHRNRPIHNNLAVGKIFAFEYKQRWSGVTFPVKTHINVPLFLPLKSCIAWRRMIRCCRPRMHMPFPGISSVSSRFQIIVPLILFDVRAVSKIISQTPCMGCYHQIVVHLDAFSDWFAPIIQRLLRYALESWEPLYKRKREQIAIGIFLLLRLALVFVWV